MFGLSHWELLVILIVALLLFGSRLPSVAKSLGRSISSFRQGLRDLENHKDDEKPTNGESKA